MYHRALECQKLYQICCIEYCISENTVCCHRVLEVCYTFTVPVWNNLYMPLLHLIPTQKSEPDVIDYILEILGMNTEPSTPVAYESVLTNCSLLWYEMAMRSGDILQLCRMIWWKERKRTENFYKKNGKC